MNLKFKHGDYVTQSFNGGRRYACRIIGDTGDNGKFKLVYLHNNCGFTDSLDDESIWGLETKEDYAKRIVKQGKIVCLCGSTKFKEAFEEATRTESLKGNIVLTVAMFGHLQGLDMNSIDKIIFDELHKKKIELCNEVLVLNVDNYLSLIHI